MVGGRGQSGRGGGDARWWRERTGGARGGRLAVDGGRPASGGEGEQYSRGGFNKCAWRQQQRTRSSDSNRSSEGRREALQALDARRAGVREVSAAGEVVDVCQLDRLDETAR